MEALLFYGIPIIAGIAVFFGVIAAIVWIIKKIWKK